MVYSKLDLFSSQFAFNIGNNQKKRGTLFGTILSFMNMYQDDYLKMIEEYNCDQKSYFDKKQSEINNNNLQQQDNKGDNEEIDSQPIFVPAFVNKIKMLLDVDQALNMNDTNMDTQNKKTNQNSEEKQFQIQKYQMQEDEKINVEQQITLQTTEKSNKQSQLLNNLNIQEYLFFINQEKDKKLSHYEMQYSILQSPKFQEEYIEEFLKRCQEQEENTSNLDQRILTSIKNSYKI
ncbi:hypothetical protein ABPG73_004684 [Tetrahymena malaccensis]